MGGSHGQGARGCEVAVGGASSPLGHNGTVERGGMEGAQGSIGGGRVLKEEEEEEEHEEHEEHEEVVAEGRARAHSRWAEAAATDTPACARPRMSYKGGAQQPLLRASSVASPMLAHGGVSRVLACGGRNGTEESGRGSMGVSCSKLAGVSRRGGLSACLQESVSVQGESSAGSAGSAAVAHASQGQAEAVRRGPYPAPACQQKQAQQPCEDHRQQCVLQQVCADRQACVCVCQVSNAYWRAHFVFVHMRVCVCLCPCAWGQKCM